ncbi:unnamed protein product [Linum trigynum]|uniref:Gnk2-homologous domain-containing protein n=1 Tax=Linum trigynum TaxID=586398 RepID=A0AAV2G614_9ROSI
MGSSGNDNKVFLVVVLLIIIFYHTWAAAGEGSGVQWLCNPDTFSYDDHRLGCVYDLLEILMGPEVTLEASGGYKNQDCGDSTIYGYSWVEENRSGCLNQAKDVIENQHCHHRMGAQAWNTDCLLRFELYPFQV